MHLREDVGESLRKYDVSKKRQVVVKLLDEGEYYKSDRSRQNWIFCKILYLLLLLGSAVLFDHSASAVGHFNVIWYINFLQAAFLVCLGWVLYLLIQLLPASVKLEFRKYRFVRLFANGSFLAAGLLGLLGMATFFSGILSGEDAFQMIMDCAVGYEIAAFLMGIIAYLEKRTIYRVVEKK